MARETVIRSNYLGTQRRAEDIAGFSSTKLNSVDPRRSFFFF